MSPLLDFRHDQIMQRMRTILRGEVESTGLLFRGVSLRNDRVRGLRRHLPTFGERGSQSTVLFDQVFLRDRSAHGEPAELRAVRRSNRGRRPEVLLVRMPRRGLQGAASHNDLQRMRHRVRGQGFHEASVLLAPVFGPGGTASLGRCRDWLTTDEQRLRLSADGLGLDSGTSPRHGREAGPSASRARAHPSPQRRAG